MTTTATVTAIAKTATCSSCGRVLRNAESVARGIGPKCLRAARQRAAQLDATYTDAQIESAIEAIEDGAVVPSCRPLLYFVVSTDGSENHLVNLIEDTCNCPAGRADRACYHLAAAQAVDLPQAA